MKKKVISILLMTVMVISMMSGCGKSEDAEERQESMIALTDDIQLFEATEEIKNAKLTDMVLQINDVILRYDASMKLQELIDAFNESADGDRISFISFNGQSEFLADELLQPGEYNSLYIVYDFNSDGVEEKRIGGLSIYNDTEEAIENAQASIVIFSPERTIDNICPMNVILPGGYRYGCIIEDANDSKYYALIDESEILSYADFEEYLPAQIGGSNGGMISEQEGEIVSILWENQLNNGQKAHYTYSYEITSFSKEVVISELLSIN